MRDREDVVEKISGRNPTVRRLIVGFLRKIGKEI